MNQNPKNGNQDCKRIPFSRDSELEDLLRLAPEVSDEKLSSLLVDYAEKKKETKESKRKDKAASARKVDAC